MPKVQEFVLQAPSMANDYFHVQKESHDYQRWEHTLYDGAAIEFCLESEQQWIRAKVDSVYIDDGSGNAPEANAHFSAKWQDERGRWQYTLHEDLRVRIEAPTDDELIARSGWCEGVDYEPVGPYNPDRQIHCSKRGTMYVAPSGQNCWYCDEHKPVWLEIAAV